MYSRGAFTFTRLLSAGLSIVMELFVFYNLFLELYNASEGDKTNLDGIIFYIAMTALSLFAYELGVDVIEFGDKLEEKGVSVWKVGPKKRKIV